MTLTCIRECVIRNSHLTNCSDLGCKGCLPRPSDEGYLCDRCYTKLRTLLASKSNPESLACIIDWLGENRGQNLTQTLGGGISGKGGVASYGERSAVILSTSVDIQRSLRELLSDFAPEATPALDATLMYLGMRLDALANWEPIGDHLTHLEDLREDAHAVAPWREKKDDKIVRAAALLFLAPAETVPELATRFNVKESKIRKLHKDGYLSKDDIFSKVVTHRPWFVFKILEPEAATDMEYKLVQYQSKLVHITSPDKSQTNIEIGDKTAA